MAPKGPLRTFRKCLLDANWTLFRDSLGGRALRSSMILKRPVGNSSFGLFRAPVIMESTPSFTRKSPNTLGNRKGTE